MIEELIAASPYGCVLDGTLDDPGWANAGKVHDWRNYVPCMVQEVWDEMPEVARAVAYLMASEQASQENWE